MKSKYQVLSVLALAAALSGPAWASGSHAGGHGSEAPIGQPGKAERVTRTVTIAMTDDMRFTPSTVTVRRGETVRFVVRNEGQLKHEFVLGTEADHKAHYEQMKRFPGMEHEEPSMVTVSPGGQGEVLWHFTQGQTVQFACLQVGHYDAGMKGRIQVADRKNSSQPTRK